MIHVFNMIVFDKIFRHHTVLLQNWHIIVSFWFFGSDFYLKSFQSDQIEGWDLFNWIGRIGRLASQFENGRHSMDGALYEFVFVFFSFVFIISFTSWPEDQFVKWSISLVATTVLIFLFFLYTLYTLIHLCAHRHNRHYSFCTTPKKFFCSYFCCDNDQKNLFHLLKFQCTLTEELLISSFVKGAFQILFCQKYCMQRGRVWYPKSLPIKILSKNRYFWFKNIILAL